MTEIDTSREAVEATVSLLKHNREWPGLQDVDVEAYDSAAQQLTALLDRAEKAEAERDRLRVECARRAALVGFAYAEGVSDVEVGGANTENVDLMFGSSYARAALDDPEVHQAEWPEHYQDAIRALRK